MTLSAERYNVRRPWKREAEQKRQQPENDASDRRDVAATRFVVSAARTPSKPVGHLHSSQQDSREDDRDDRFIHAQGLDCL
jgi:hypothetical protein